MRPSARRSDDSDVIRARLRALLAEGQARGGWTPEEEPEPDEWEDDEPAPPVRRPVEPAEPPLPAGLGRHRAPGATARLDPGRPGSWALWAVAVVAAAALVGWTWLGRPAVEPVPVAVTAAAPSSAPSSTAALPAPPPDGTVVVSVVGLVVSPGLVTLPAGARVADALAAAGGLLPEADPASVNAAALLADGQQVAVGVPGAAGAPLAGAPPAGAAGTGDGGLLDLNTATTADLDALPGIGPVLAQRIVDHRAEHGPFASIEQLDDVSGIGPAVFAELAERVRV
ncbi:helix-hairpin-helix domain-containing protein [Modestobacter sp. VKM Ac-2986]|uniref:ComEA family DNA-binding protein n=1 Tax=Modestobacter sp. VKM Ac-2986 TaxID=3004140 RepID=UPI0022A9F6EE|nr:helix-hairpin-helix domain-containing protein [Modestobacter sp. VKM Ac-2986]MCZ2828551.1 helix-hairpin-helix domain-containing protein [Modestobacter sp. VKM Ac-2986]